MRSMRFRPTRPLQKIRRVRASSAVDVKSVVCVAADALAGVVNDTVPCSETSMKSVVSNLGLRESAIC